MMLTASTGPIFKGETRKLKDQCKLLQHYVGDAVDEKSRKALVPELIRRWRRDGAERSVSGDNVHTLCHAVKSALGLKETPEEIAEMIVDDGLSPVAFARCCGVEEIDYDHILAEHNATRGHFWPPEGHLFQNVPRASPHPATGIFVVERTGRGQSSKALLVIGNHVEIDGDDDRRSFVFLKMFVPQPDAPKPISVYQGMMVQPVNHKYFLLHSVEATVQDFILMITDVGSLPAVRFRGVYTSVNILGDGNPNSLKVDIQRKETVVSDANIKRLGKEHLKELWRDDDTEGER